MAARPTWKGYLKISLVNIPVRVFPATDAAATISFNQLHRECRTRIQQKRWCPTCQTEVPNTDLVKGYEFEKGKYVVLDEDDIAKVRPESTRVINVVQFTDAKVIDPVYVERPYYLAPDGNVAAEAFAVMREGMAGKAAVGKVALYGREYLVAIQPRENGLVMYTLRHASEVRSMGAIDELVFRDRRDAGRELAKLLQGLKAAGDVVVLALPRGGVPVAYEIARALDATLDVFLVRKLGTPGHAELAMGAIASGGSRVINEEVVQALHIPQDVIDAAASREQSELERRDAAYRQGRQLAPLENRTVILVDDGLATGSTMKAAVQAVKQHKPVRVVVAVPVGAPETCHALRELADEVICARTPSSFSAVGQWYRDFSQTTDDEVIALLNESKGRPARLR